MYVYVYVYVYTFMCIRNLGSPPERERSRREKEIGRERRRGAESESARTTAVRSERCENRFALHPFPKPFLANQNLHQKLETSKLVVYEVENRPFPN